MIISNAPFRASAALTLATCVAAAACADPWPEPQAVDAVAFADERRVSVVAVFV